ncbi:MAG: hypothetical protein KGL39_58210 [Patescibacteria group bacterium]|nr:hypothetical protein [Patescibacteria group bacterium]
MLYLIAHLVRGEPAFDIAHEIEIGDEIGWIIPTSGHRAYPYWQTELNNCFANGIAVIPEPPSADWPDHYPTAAASPSFTGNLLAALGLAAPKTPTITRR